MAFAPLFGFPPYVNSMLPPFSPIDINSPLLFPNGLFYYGLFPKQPVNFNIKLRKEQEKNDYTGIVFAQLKILFRIILEKLCDPTINEEQFAENIYREITNGTRNELNGKCDNPIIIQPAAAAAAAVAKPDGDCHANFILTKDRLKKLYTRLQNTDFLTKACKIKNYDANYVLNLNISKQSGGTYENSYINFEELFGKKYELMCVMEDGSLKCTRNSEQSQQFQPCRTCQVWAQKRDLFRDTVVEMLNQSDIIGVIDIMIKNVNLFPAAILNEQEYHRFHNAITAFLAMKRRSA